MRTHPYISDQAWRVLVDFDTPRKHLTTAHFRAGRPGQPTGPGDAADDSAWINVLPLQVLTGNWGDAQGPNLHPNLFDANGKPRSAQRVVITSDAGMGKTTTIDWLRYRLGLPDLAAVPIAVPLRVLLGEEAGVDQRLERYLVDQIERGAKENGCDTATARQSLDQSRRRGRLVLLFDGLDQVPAAVTNLQQVLQSPFYAKCRMVVAGRPYSIQRHWKDLFAQEDWLFVRVEEFNEPQQQTYLGDTAKPGGAPGEQTSRWELVPEDGRRLLSTPRVLQYVRSIPDAELPQLRTAADVYLRAIDVLLREGIQGSPKALLLGWPEKERVISATVHGCNLDEGWKLLGAIAFEMTAQTIEVRDADGNNRLAPNFDRVEAGDAFRDFKWLLEQRYKSRSHGGLNQDLIALAALNDVLEHGVFDTDREDLEEVQFRNRSLQEFLCAYYLATEAFANDPRGEPLRSNEAMGRDAAWLDQHLYLPDRLETEEYYYVWQFLADMPAETKDSAGKPVRGRDAASWLRAIAPLYQPAQRVTATPRRSTREGRGLSVLLNRFGWGLQQCGKWLVRLVLPGQTTWQARRSSEMIYRSWWGLQEYCEEKNAAALQLRNTWQGEFEQIANNAQGPARRQAAQALRDSFLTLPAGQFLMGSPPEKQGMPADLRAEWQRWLAAAPASGHEAYAKAEVEGWVWRGAVGQREKADRLRLLQQALAADSVDVLASAWYPGDETPVETTQSMGRFELSRQPVSNAWYRLYAPGHGLAPADYHMAYTSFSPSGAHPAIYLTWFDAWAFAHWCHWEGRSCRLPFENEWEYAAKFDQADPWRDYWWGPDYDQAFCNARNDVGKTTVPNPRHASVATKRLDPSGLGLMDLSGNVWEWCADVYRPKYQRHDEDMNTCQYPVSRVLRGGAFHDDADHCRSAYRGLRTPASTFSSLGVRLARAE
jgi:formylglycine-generating enzyme required for sulfatase activity